MGPVLADSLSDQAGLHTFNFLANSVLQEADTQMAAAFPGAYVIKLQMAVCTFYFDDAQVSFHGDLQKGHGPVHNCGCCL